MRHHIALKRDEMLPPDEPMGRQHRIPKDPDETCIHPRRAVLWNPYKFVYQCHICGVIMYEPEETEQ